MKRVIIIQSRMTSTRLPGKILMDVAGKPMLAQQLRRLKQCRAVDQIVVATTDNSADDPVVELARKEGVGWFRGSEHDVLGRYVGAAREAKADIVIRSTGDCPLIDARVTDAVIHELEIHAATADYVCNFKPRTFPRGLDVEAFFSDVLWRVDRLAQTRSAREHVTLFIHAEHPELFWQRNIADNQDNSDLRWTVDEEVDLQLVRLIYDALDLGSRAAPYEEILAYVRRRPELAGLNAGVTTWKPPGRKQV